MSSATIRVQLPSSQIKSVVVKEVGPPGPSGTDNSVTVPEAGKVPKALGDATIDTGWIKYQMSVSGDSSGLKLSGDSASPGANHVYGTDASGVKGWKPDPAAGVNAAIDVTVTPFGGAFGLTSTNVQAALQELETEKLSWIDFSFTNIDDIPANVTLFGNLASGANLLPYFSSPSTMATCSFTAAARTFLAATDAAAQRAAIGVDDSVVSLVPSTVYAVEGTEFNIYNTNAAYGANDLDGYAIAISSDIGYQYERSFTLTPNAGQAGSHTLSFSVSSNDHARNYIAQSSTLIVRANAYPVTPVTRKLLVIGDSTTNNGEYLAELVKLFSSDTKYTLTLVGRKTASVNDSSATPRTIYHEGNDGWSINKYVTDVTSPFWNGSGFSFSYYTSTNSIVLSANDWVFINLGINDVMYSADDAALATKITTILSQYATAIASIKAAVSGVRIGVCLTIPPSASQSAFMSGQTQKRYKRNHDKLVKALIDTYDNGAVAGVTIVPINLGLDTLFNMQMTAVKANSRNPYYYNRQTNAVHPASYGYYQIADQIRAFLKGVE